MWGIEGVFRGEGAKWGCCFQAFRAMDWEMIGWRGFVLDLWHVILY
uniref:Uncharacterized protein n=1 Tax=Candidatus Kentrum sp. MB TaxID=2138164 RepID=A0A450XWH9_9GAMM|nr:MAG: hypothetical protein BECKMB1821G_GA0114241_105011 [Candidatus Kentron sp. MB]VFK33638.1 MAG: hypothetical protein BECKMB1821I_GA0114274_10509 [Candidatus Kentron sp. MB]VFK76340.1 MAG: hypothetical protein BECKMB1821H_GA0114242_10529 [Candidatus Kentron sp. MB]